MEQPKNKTIVDKIWEFLASIRLAIVIFALIALTSIIGTILEQQADPAKNILILTKLFGESLAPGLYRIFDNLGFMDMYHSWWFVALLILFSSNLVICSLDRFPRIWKVVREPIGPMKEEQLKKFSINREVLLKGKPDKVKDVVAGALKSAGFHYTGLKENKGYQFFSQKGRFSRLGVYVTHFSILIILIGAIIGIFFGFKGFVNIPEGKSYSVAFLPAASLTQMDENKINRILQAIDISSGNISNAATLLGIDEKSLMATMDKYGIKPLGFSIRNDDFEIDFYGGSDMPKEYKSALTVIDNGKEVFKKVIKVNEPLQYRGITFYQSSYGMVPNAHGEFILRVTSRSGTSETKQLHLEDKFTIPGTSIEGTIKDFSPALKFDPHGNPYTYADMMNNPAVFIDFTEDGKTKYSGWIFKRYPTTWKLPEGHTVEFLDLWGAQYTGLQVRKDPGVWVVYLGCIAMSIGLFIAFFLSHRKIWVKIVEDKNNTRVIVGATSNKNRAAFERKIDKMISILNKKQGGEK